MFLRSGLLQEVEGVVHGFGTQEEPIPGALKEIWESSRPVWKQVHGVSLAVVKGPKQECDQVDAFYTTRAGIPIGVFTADCVPVLMARRSESAGSKQPTGYPAVVAVHAGWRGTRAGILVEVWKSLKKLGYESEDWVAAVGPAVGPCCYEVSEELAEDFRNEFKRFGNDIAVPDYRRLDLQAVNQHVLLELGFSKVEILRHCTLCSKKPLFNSFRREAGKSPGRQASIIMLK